jgi:RNA polymerase sigma-70 factor (ECF subfamily)
MAEITETRICYSWNQLGPLESGESTLNQYGAMNGFLQDVERRALRIAELSVGNREDALELVQEAMLGLVKRYAHRPGDEWKPLFYRILKSRINDFHRRRAVRQRFMAFLPASADPDDPTTDPIENASAGERDNPVHALQQDVANKAMLEAIGALPTRQQQAFVLRAWEGMSVRETATAMACSEGSVKTHYNRAVKALQLALTELMPHDIV